MSILCGSVGEKGIRLLVAGHIFQREKERERYREKERERASSSINGVS